jgi:2-dehydro-3-deoxyphosphogluconate aldolase/(4S)-4-hydroxy-2-oxoglutarate aldolase
VVGFSRSRAYLSPPSTDYTAPVTTPVADQCARAGLLAIIRADSAVGLTDAARALAAGGVTAMEITLNTPGALGAIADVRRALPDMLCGAGTILMPDDAVAAVEAGAQFIITPTLQVDTIALCNARGVPISPGCASPIEAVAAHRAGADFVKIFPASRFALAHIRDMLEELPRLRLIPTGGVTPENLHTFFEVGCAGVAVGSNLVSKAMVAGRDWGGITRIAREFVDAVDAARGAKDPAAEAASPRAEVAR